MNLTEISIKKPVLAWMLMLALVIFGVLALTRTGISQFPDVDFPTINVSVGYEGASPEVMESDVVDVIEDALTQVEGVKEITSTCRHGSASITLELDLERDVDTSLQDVQTKVAQAQRRLPRDIDPPVVSKNNPEDQPVMWISLSGARSPQELADYARYVVKDRLQTLPGVGEVIVGTLDRNVRIWIDHTRLDAHGLTIEDVVSALSREHVELPAGRIETDAREVNVRVEGEALDLEEFRSLVLRDNAGAQVRLADVAIVEDGFQDVRRISRAMGEPAQSMGVKKQRGANAVEVARRIREELPKLQKQLPEGMSLGINFDSTPFIEDAVDEIEFGIVLAVILTALVCWLFLGNFSSTFNILLAIPMSLCGTLAVIYFAGFTLNTFTLLALSLSIGIVVDDAIMVMENIQRHGEMGKDRITAAREGTREITFAALAATAAIIAIFLPVVFMKGVVGKFFLQFGITLSAAVAFSYLEAITLTPARCAQFLAAAERQNRLGRFVDRFFKRLSELYRRTLAGALARRGLVLVAALIVCLLPLGLLKVLRKEFVPSQDQSLSFVRIQTPVGSSITETEKLFTRCEQFLLGRKEVRRFVGSVGGFGGGEVNTGVFFISLVKPHERELTQQGFMDVIRKEFNSYPGLRANVQDLSQRGFSASRGYPIEFSIRGPDWKVLASSSQEIVEKLNDSGVATDVDTDYQVGMPELRILPDRERAADVGVSMGSLATTINALVGGVRVGKFKQSGRRLDVRVRLLQAQRLRPEDVTRLLVRTESGDLVPLASLVRLVEEPTLQVITRRQRQRAITLFANVTPGVSQQAAIEKAEKLARESLPEGYNVVLGGASVTFKESMGGLLFALFLGIVVAYMVLASQFNSLVHPLTVLTILPLSIAGAIIGLWLAGQSLNIFSMIGLLLLMGLVKKNSIILVDYANQARARGVDGLAAMLEAGPVRLRPILMTSIATIVAAIPPALSFGPGGEIRAPMAIAVIGGMLLSTFLSLLVVPCVYVSIDSLRERAAAWRARRKEEAAAMAELAEER